MAMALSGGRSLSPSLLGQLTRWAVSFKAAAGNKSIRLGLRENVIREGESTQVQVRLEERFYAQNPNVTIEAVLTRQGEGRPFAQTLKLVPREGNPLLLEAPVTGFPPGEYKVQLRVNDAEVKEELLEAMLAVNCGTDPRTSGCARQSAAIGTTGEQHWRYVSATQ